MYSGEIIKLFNRPGQQVLIMWSSQSRCVHVFQCTVSNSMHQTEAMRSLHWWWVQSQKGYDSYFFSIDNQIWSQSHRACWTRRRHAILLRIKAAHSAFIEGLSEWQSLKQTKYYRSSVTHCFVQAKPAWCAQSKPLVQGGWACCQPKCWNTVAAKVKAKPWCSPWFDIHPRWVLSERRKLESLGSGPIALKKYERLSFSEIIL